MNQHPLAYRTYDAALAARMNIGAQIATPLRIEKCDECRRWHLIPEVPIGQQPKAE